MLLVRRQRRASSASCAGLQSRQLHADTGSAGGDQTVVAAGETREDRRQGRAPWPLRHLPDGRVAVPRELFHEILRLIAELRPQLPPAPA
jgi:hypothetical protein